MTGLGLERSVLGGVQSVTQVPRSLPLLPLNLSASSLIFMEKCRNDGLLKVFEPLNPFAASSQKPPPVHSTLGGPGPPPPPDLEHPQDRGILHLIYVRGPRAVHRASAFVNTQPALVD